MAGLSWCQWAATVWFCFPKLLKTDRLCVSAPISPTNCWNMSKCSSPLKRRYLGKQHSVLSYLKTRALIMLLMVVQIWNNQKMICPETSNMHMRQEMTSMMLFTPMWMDRSAWTQCENCNFCSDKSIDNLLSTCFIPSTRACKERSIVNQVTQQRTETSG